MFIYLWTQEHKKGELPWRSSKIIRFMAGNRNIRDPSVNHHFEKNKNPIAKKSIPIKIPVSVIQGILGKFKNKTKQKKLN